MTQTPTSSPPPPMNSEDDDNLYVSDRARAFKAYKEGVRTSGKPFFPFGVWHDLIAACGIVAVIILLTVVWFAQANCDSWFNVSCDRAATPIEQEQYRPGNGDKVDLKENGEPNEDGKKPLLGPLYEDKADPATTNYHPRPEWYFYFLFYLLIVFSHPQSVVIGTIILPTIFIVLLVGLPFYDRKRERRPSRRPIAMATMTVTAVMLLAFTYLGSKAGEETVEGVSEAQQEMPGFALIFEDARGQSCKGCHVIGGAGGNVGPNLDEEASRDRGLDWQIAHLADPQSKVPGSAMPAQRASFDDEELAHLGAFLETLGAPEKAEDPELTGADASDTARALGDEEDAEQDESGGDAPGDVTEGGDSDETTQGGTGQGAQAQNTEG